MTRENTIAETVPEDPLEKRWYENVQRWVRNEIDYDELLKSYPSTGLRVKTAVEGFVKNLFSQTPKK